jgi:hypothetical protein
MKLVKKKKHALIEKWLINLSLLIGLFYLALHFYNIKYIKSDFTIEIATIQDIIINKHGITYIYSYEIGSEKMKGKFFDLKYSTKKNVIVGENYLLLVSNTSNNKSLLILDELIGKDENKKCILKKYHGYNFNE